MSRLRILVLALIATGVAGWALSDRLGMLLQLVGSPVAASAGALSEHDLEELNTMAPQDQALRLLEKAINHYRGASEEIARRLDGWTGKMAPSKELESLTSTAYFSSDLRVRALALEIWLARDDLRKTPETVDRLIAEAGARDDRQYWRLSNLGILGNRGVEPDKVLRTLLEYVHDPAGDTRASAINGWDCWEAMAPSRRCWRSCGGTRRTTCASARRATWRIRACSRANCGGRPSPS